jgi:hypothetical protein
VQSKQLEKLTQHQATWSKVDLLHAAPCLREAFYKYGLNFKPEGEAFLERKESFVSLESGEAKKSRETTVIIEKSGLEIGAIFVLFQARVPN